MTILNFKLLLLTLCVSCCKGGLESHKRLRSLRNAGFEHVGTATILEINDEGRQSFDEGRLRERRSSGDGENVHLNIKVDETGDEYQLHLRHARSVLHPEAKLFLSQGDHQVEMKKRDVKCILSNKPSDNLAVISYCRNTRGVFHHDGYEYAIETLDELKNHRNKRSEKKFIIAKRSLEKNSNLYGDTVEDLEDVVRNKRNTQTTVERPDHFEIETALVVDADMVSFLKNDGHTEYDDWLDYMLIKWTGVQAIWSDKELMGYDVKIYLKYVDFWETDPSFYTSSIKIAASTKLVCDHAKQNRWPYDHVHLQLGRTDGTSMGISWLGGMCGLYRCSCIRNRDCYAFKGPAHEIGHNLGLPHNSPAKDYCGPGDGGIMGYGNVGLSSCNYARLTERVSKSPRYNCLFREDVKKANVAELDDVYPGQYMLPDELCDAEFGEKHLYQPNDPICGRMKCKYIGTDRSRQGYIYQTAHVPRGMSCGPRKMCIESKCVTWEESGRNVAELEANVVIGGWSEFIEVRRCPPTSTCGNFFKVHRRFCNNPKPVNSPLCEGRPFRVYRCPNEPCAEKRNIAPEVRETNSSSIEEFPLTEDLDLETE